MENIYENMDADIDPFNDPLEEEVVVEEKKKPSKAVKEEAIDPKEAAQVEQQKNENKITLDEKPKKKLTRDDHNATAEYVLKETARGLDKGLSKFAGGWGDIVDNFTLLGQLTNEDSFLQRNIPMPSFRTERTWSDKFEDTVDFVDKDPESVGGRIVADLTQFGLGWASGRRILGMFTKKGVQDWKGKAKNVKDLFEIAKRKARVVGFEATAGGLGTFIAADPHAERLADLLQTFPSLHGPVMDYVFESLESNKNDGVLEGKFKAGIEDFVTGAAIEVIFTGVKLFKEGLRVYGKQGQEAYAKFLDKNADTMNGVVQNLEKEQGSWKEIHEVNAGDIIEQDLGSASKFETPAGIDIKDVRSRKIIDSVTEKDRSFGGSSGNTAIGRGENVSVPVRELSESVKRRIIDPDDAYEGTGRTLHAGSGRVDNPDIRALDDLTDGQTVHYDPNHNPSTGETLGKQDFDTVVSPYVLNTLPKSLRDTAMLQLSHSMKDGGEGFITVRGVGGMKPTKNWKKYQDGWEVPKSGQPSQFQKGYTKESLEKELGEFFEEVKIIKGGKGKNPQSLTAKVGKPKRTEQATGETFKVRTDTFQMTDRGVSSFIAKLGDLTTFHTKEGEWARGAELSGAMNWDRMLDSEAVKGTIDTLAKLVKAQGGHGDIETHAQTVAKAVGMDKTALLGRMRMLKTSTEDMAATLVASREMLGSISHQIYKVGTLVDKTGDKEAKVELLKLLEIQADLFDSIKQVRRSAARTTQAGRIRTKGAMTKEEIAEIIETNGSDKGIEQLAARIKAAGEGGTIDDVLSVTKKTTIDKLVDVHNEFWIAGILGGIKTHVVNVSSASLNTFWLPMQKMVGGAMRGLNPNNDFDSMFEAGREMVYLTTVVGDALKMAWKAMQMEDAILDSTARTIDGQALKAIDAGNFGFDTSIKREEDFIEWVAVKGINFLGHLVRIPNRFLLAEDEFFKQLNFRASLKAQAYGDAIKLGKSTKKNVPIKLKNGKTTHVSEVDKYMMDAMDKAIDAKTGAGAKGQHLDRARQSTFTDDLKDMPTWQSGNKGNFGANLQSFVNQSPALRGTILPFIRVPTNLFRTAVDNSPAAVLTARFWKAMKEGTESQKSLALGKVTTGSLVWFWSYNLAAEGRITGAAPRDKELRDSKMATGWRPYSFVIGDFTLDENGRLLEDNRRYINFQRLDPYGIPFGIAADMVAISNKVDQGVYDDVAGRALMAMANNLGSKSYLKGLLDVFKIIEDEDGFIGEKLLRQKAASYIPNSFGMFDFINEDEAMKETRSTLDAVLKKTPGFSDVLEPRRDLFGEKIMPPDGQPWKSINPFTVGKAKNDPVRFELNRLAEGPGNANFTGVSKIVGRNIDLTKYTNSKGQTAYDRTLEILSTMKKPNGRTLHQQLKHIMDKPSYNRGDKEGLDGTAMFPKGRRTEKLQNAIRDYKNEALKQMQKEFHKEWKTGKIQGEMSLKELIKKNKNAKTKTKKGKGEQAQEIRDLFN
tara:strand:- start:618 stop:5099 length:4482 start_codon:yes stop_codon:yes gene_type:complete